MFEHLKVQSSQVLGIDIGSTSIKLIELIKSNKGFRILSYGWSTLPEGAVVDKQILDKESVSAAIRAAVKQAKTRQKKAIVAVNGSLVIRKWIAMDASLSEDEMASQIQVEADQYIPYPLDEVAIDFAIDKPLENQPDQVSVLVAACRKENVVAREEVLNMAGLKAMIVDVEPYAIERVYPLLVSQMESYHSDDTVALVDISSVVTILTVLQHGATIYTREQAFGGRELTEAIMKAYQLSAQDAERIKTQVTPSHEYQKELLPEFLHSAAQQIARSLTFFYSATSHAKVRYILLTGGSALLPGLCAVVAEKIGVPTLLADPCQHMSVAQQVDVDQLRAHAPTLMTVCGLAMRGTR